MNKFRVLDAIRNMKGMIYMKKSVFLLLLAVPMLLAASVEIGSNQVSGSKPFCGN